MLPDNIHNEHPLAKQHLKKARNNSSFGDDMCSHFNPRSGTQYAD